MKRIESAKLDNKKSSYFVKQSSKYAGDGYWDWSVWIESRDSNALDDISSVTYNLHYTFIDPVRIIKDRERKFRLDTSGWGEFTIYIVIKLKNNSLIELEHDLSLNEPITSMKNMATKKQSINKTPLNKVFISYSQEDIIHTQSVVSFVNFLRINGFEADIDLTIFSKKNKESEKTVYQNIKDSKIVVVVLSEGYKKMAENSIGLVGKEYRYILRFIKAEISKFIFVSFNSLTKSTMNRIVPSGFKSYEIIDLYKDEDNGFNTLFTKLRGEQSIKLVELKNKLPDIKVEDVPVFTLRPSSPLKLDKRSGNQDLEKLLNTLFYKITHDSYFESYKTKIDCEYAVISGILAVKKRVHLEITLVNPLPNSLEEANFFSTYIFSTIKGIDNKELLKLKKFIVTIDSETNDITKSIAIDGKPSDLYPDSVEFRYKRLEEGYQNSPLRILFQKSMVIELIEERIVPYSDVFYTKEFNKLIKNFSLEYSFPNMVDGSFKGNFMRSLAENDKIEVKPSKNGKSILLKSKDWLIPGDGVFIFTEK
jgi:transcription initiation factor IIF auxiliary subunit